MNEYLLLTNTIKHRKYLVRVLEDTQTNNIFINHAGYWCISFLCKNPPRFIIKDTRTHKWIKRPILDLIKIQNHREKAYYSSELPPPIKYQMKISRQMLVCLKREHQLLDYLNDIIKKENLPLIVKTNGMSGANKVIPGDLHLFNKDPFELKLVIEYLSLMHNTSIRLDEKNILQDRARVKKVNRSIHYIIAYTKYEDEKERIYGFYNIDTKNRNHFKNKTSISLTKLRENEVDITQFLKRLC